MTKLSNLYPVPVLAACAAALLLACAGGAALARPGTPDDSGADAASARPDAVLAARAHDEGIEGAWESSVTLQDCRSGAVLRTFKGLTVLHRGGTASATNNLPPTSGSPAYGTWKRASIAGSFDISLRFFRFNPDGSWAGAQNLRRRVTQLDGNTLSGTVSAQVLDSAGNILQSVCGSEAATRVAGF
jgi:hypothetical protein